MKIIHTSDWHLGQKFLSHSREEEHEAALNWLLELVQSEAPDALLVAGDIFDIGNPPNSARKSYYRFLRQMMDTPCRHVIITGGNHDSPAMLNAPRELLAAMQVHVVGNAGADPAEEVIPLYNAQKELEAVIAAVPFLRDRDISEGVSGETGLDRIAKIKQGIRGHYERVAAHISSHFPVNEVPVIAMGHLYASGATASGKQDNIYIGNTENIDATHFPEVFDYVALGHIHRAQRVGRLEHVRYSGSLIPLSFSEVRDTKSVWVLEWEGKNFNSRAAELPVFRQLRTIAGSLEEVKAKIEGLAQKAAEAQFPPWADIRVHLDALLPDLNESLREFASGLPLEILKIQAVYPNRKNLQEQQLPMLEDLSPIEVFRMKCERMGESPKQMEELLEQFRELQDWYRESEQA